MKQAVTAPDAEDTSTWRKELRAFAEILALWGFAIAQPLLDLFGRNPTQFVFHNADTADIVVFAFVVAFVPPAILWAIEAVAGRIVPRFRAVLHLTILALLVAAFVMQAARGLITRAPLVVVAVAAAAGAVWLYQRFTATRLWLSYAALAPIAFVVLFLFTSDTSRLLFTSDARAVEAGVGKPAPVIMIVFDEFPLYSIITRDASLDRDLYPNIAALADQSSWFRNATGVSNATWFAVPPVSTGRYPKDGDAPVAADHPESIFTLLGNAYNMNVTESITRLCPPNICKATLPGSGNPETQLLKDAMKVMRSRLSYSGTQGDPVAGLVERPAATEVPADDNAFGDFMLNQPQRVLSLLGGMKDGSATLHYLHLLMPHVPYRFLPSGQEYLWPDPDVGRVDDNWVEEEWPATLGRQRLQMQAAYVDRLIGSLVSVLRDRDLYDKSMIVVTADHGVAADAGGPIRGTEGQELDLRAQAELAWVPFFVKRPGQQRGEVSDANVQTIDVLPTIADVIDVDIPWPVDGRSVFGPPRTDNLKRFTQGSVDAFGMEAAEPTMIDGAAGWQVILDHAIDTVLPPAGTPDRLWRVGPAPELVGTAVDAQPAGTLEPVRATFDDGDTLESVDPAAPVPALIRGSLTGVAADEPIAIVVNGTIGATVPAYRDGSATKFAGMVDPARLRPGENDVVIYRIPR
jgi:hypothetical protein